MGTPILKCNDLVIGYQPGKPVLDGISFQIEAGERFIVLGESGCGKSTLLKGIIGLNPPESGEILFQNRKLSYPLKESDPFYQSIGILYQNSALLNAMTIEENVMLPIKMHHPECSAVLAQGIAQEKLAMVNLYHHRDKYPRELSGGMKKRAALARAMVMDPEIIFFDEPQAGLDPVTAMEMDMLFLHLNEILGISFFIVTHELLSIKRTGQKILMLADKKILFHGTLDDALESDIFRVKRFFNVDRYRRD